MQFLIRLSYLTLTFAAAPLAPFSGHAAPDACQAPECAAQPGPHEVTSTVENARRTLAFYIPRPLRGPQASTLAFYIPRPLRGPQV